MTVELSNQCFEKLTKQYVYRVVVNKKTVSFSDLEKTSQPVLIFIHGWGAHGGAFDEVVSLIGSDFAVCQLNLPGFGENTLSHKNYQSVCSDIAKLIPHNCVLIGWSLGAMLIPSIKHAMNVLGKKVLSAVSIAANAKFVSDASYSTAMSPQDYTHFLEKFELSPPQLFKRFVSLQVLGDKNVKDVKKKFTRFNAAWLLSPEPKQSAQFKLWKTALQWLDEIDNRLEFLNIATPMLHILGEKDALVPIACSRFLESLPSNHKLITLPGISHAPHLSQPDKVADNIVHFLTHSNIKARTADAIVKPIAQRDKNKIAKSFSSAAQKYDGVATFQKKMAHKLCSHIDFAAQTIIDLGCGTGFCADILAKNGKKENKTDASIVSLDLSMGMLKVAQQKFAPQFSGVCADLEALPFKQHSVDLFVSNMSMQWCENIERVFSNAYQMLKPGGKFVFSTLGPKTLWELKQAWHDAEVSLGLAHTKHVNDFCAFDHLENIIEQSGFIFDRKERSLEVVHYDCVLTLLKELKTVGAHNINKDQSKGLTGKAHFRLMLESYHAHIRSNKTFPLTYDMGMYVLSKPLHI